MIILVYGSSFGSCLSNLTDVLRRCVDTNMVLNWEKCHFMLQEGIVLGVGTPSLQQRHRSRSCQGAGDRKIARPPKDEKRIRSFLGHVGFIKDFSKIAKPLTDLLSHDAKFNFDESCFNAFHTLKSALTSAPVVQPPNWELPFELMCDASDFAVGAVLG
ncbi:unnamed protein product [Rhodiola kirilowii]